MEKLHSVVIGMVLCALVIGVGIGASINKKKLEEETKAQKYRFHHKCPDGTDVDYIALSKIPTVIVCQESQVDTVLEMMEEEK